MIKCQAFFYLHSKLLNFTYLMMDIKLILLLVLFVIQGNQNIYGQKDNKLIILNGIVKNYNNQIQIEDMSEMKDLILPNSDRIFTLDSSYHFSISFTLEKPGYFRLGRNLLYLSPGDSLSMLINWTWQDSSVFRGTGSQANEYLKYTPFPKAGSFLEAGVNIKATIQQTINEILKQADRRKQLLENYFNISNNFKMLEQARINADVLNSLVMINTYFPYVNNIKEDSLKIYKTEYTKIVSPYINLYSKKVNLNPQYLQLGVYRQVISSLLSRLTDKTKKSDIIKDWIKSSDLVQRFKKIDTKKDIALFEKEISDINTQRYKIAVIKTFKKLMEFRNGDVAADFVMYNTSNKPIQLSSLKGKVIYIDLWASWCGPCIGELQFLDILKEKYKNNEHIIFISLSIDDDRQKWLKKLEQASSLDNQYIIDRANLEPYSIIEIPRVLIINSEFKIESMNGDLPSSKNTISVLDKLLIQ